jgi:hypothetical protein
LVEDPHARNGPGDHRDAEAVEVEEDAEILGEGHQTSYFLVP